MDSKRIPPKHFMKILQSKKPSYTQGVLNGLLYTILLMVVVAFICMVVYYLEKNS